MPRYLRIRNILSSIFLNGEYMRGLKSFHPHILDEKASDILDKKGKEEDLVAKIICPYGFVIGNNRCCSDLVKCANCAKGLNLVEKEEHSGIEIDWGLQNESEI
jgi:hypothetical protein